MSQLLHCTSCDRTIFEIASNLPGCFCSSLLWMSVAFFSSLPMWLLQWYGAFAAAMVLSLASAIPIVYICQIPKCGRTGSHWECFPGDSTVSLESFRCRAMIISMNANCQGLISSSALKKNEVVGLHIFAAFDPRQLLCLCIRSIGLTWIHEPPHHCNACAISCNGVGLRFWIHLIWTVKVQQGRWREGSVHESLEETQHKGIDP